MMKESEYNALVEEIVNTSNQQLRDKVNHAMNNGFISGIYCLIDSVPETVAQVTTEILKKSNLLKFDD